MQVATTSARTGDLLGRGPGCAGELSHAAYALAMVSTDWGPCGVVWKNHEREIISDFSTAPVRALLCRIYTPGLAVGLLRREIQQAYANCDEVFPNDHGSFHAEIVPAWFHELAPYLQDYYAATIRRRTQPPLGDNWAFWRPHLDWSQLTVFQRQVLEVVAAIPRGAQMTYGEVAKAIGKPAACRAVGAAIGRNPWPVLVPCHRVMGSSGKLTGFSAPGGIATKRRMLALEGA